MKHKKTRTISALKDKELCKKCIYKILLQENHYCGAYVDDPGNLIKKVTCKSFELQHRAHS